MGRTIHVLLCTVCIALLFACSGTYRDTVDKLANDIYAKSIVAEPKPPRPFKSDGCSLFPDGSWVECCVIHDLSYWRGGTREERKAADLALKRCVAGYGYPKTGAIMYVGVRVGGSWWLPTSFRWGFGWNYPQSGPPNVPY